jgi:hypothetical protein
LAVRLNEAALVRALVGPQKITQRVYGCICGCGGRDPKHTRRIKRVVRDVVLGPRWATTWDGGEEHIIAIGAYMRGGEMVACGLVAIGDDDAIVPWRWYRIEEEE